MTIVTPVIVVLPFLIAPGLLFLTTTVSSSPSFSPLFLETTTSSTTLAFAWTRKRNSETSVPKGRLLLPVRLSSEWINRERANDYRCAPPRCHPRTTNSFERRSMNVFSFAAPTSALCMSSSSGGGGGGGSGEGFGSSKAPKQNREGGVSGGGGGNKGNEKSENKRGSSGSTSSNVEFELQELRANLSTMKRQNITSRYLQPMKRAELESYVKAVIQKSPSPVPLNEIGPKLPGTMWRLAFSTETATLGDLPRDANVYVKFVNEGRLDYILQFAERVKGLNALTAKSTYTFDYGPINPGLVTFVYQEITSEIFGLTIPVGFFGLLKGRANYIESAWFDGKYWIDRGYTPDGMEYYNVYVREDQ